MSRDYYAVLHLVSAILLTEGLEPRAHAGADHLLALHFVRAGSIDPARAKAFARLAQFRLQADYSRAFHFTPEGALEELDVADKTAAALRSRLASEGWYGGAAPS